MTAPSNVGYYHPSLFAQFSRPSQLARPSGSTQFTPLPQFAHPSQPARSSGVTPLSQLSRPSQPARQSQATPLSQPARLSRSTQAPKYRYQLCDRHQLEALETSSQTEPQLSRLSNTHLELSQLQHNLQSLSKSRLKPSLGQTQSDSDSEAPKLTKMTYQGILANLSKLTE